jgi:Lar family restriction alleviation protein
MRKNIKICPFCGNTDHHPSSETSYIIETSDTGEFTHFSCSRCQSIGPKGKDKKDALETWNHRKNSNPSNCPFCDSSELFTKIFMRHFAPRNDYITYVVACENCESNGPYGDKIEDAYKEWSNRTPAS